MLKKIQISRLTLVNIVASALIIGMFLSPFIYSGFHDILRRDRVTDAEPLSRTDQAAAIALQQSFINVYEKASPSVVFIKTNVLVRTGWWLDLYRLQEQAGSGIIIDGEGYIVTNNHVVQGARKIEVVFHDNTTVTATLVGRDESSDVAVIKVPASPRLVPAVLGNSDEIEVGQMVFALGAPFGLDRTFTTGIISAKQRQIDDSSYSRIQTDASINPGNSGGPLLNIYGEVVGINQSIYSTSGGSMGIGFAIPINEAIEVIDQLKTEKRAIGQPTLGVQVGQPAPSLREDLGLTEEQEGVVVIFVFPDSAAADAGIKEYDFIQKVNGEAITSAQELIQMVRKTGVGGTLKMEIIRRGERMTIEAIVGEAAPSESPFN
ncbi:MAG: trypsin-like peptidase domain-containing protein [Leptospiraceae bacterium]|nr:trypsin-like peptidase domain-containing protein [Leptospiraceae bacterium]